MLDLCSYLQLTFVLHKSLVELEPVLNFVYFIVNFEASD